jgi:hypothetical protein
MILEKMEYQALCWVVGMRKSLGKQFVKRLGMM